MAVPVRWLLLALLLAACLASRVQPAPDSGITQRRSADSAQAVQEEALWQQLDIATLPPRAQTLVQQQQQQQQQQRWTVSVPKQPLLDPRAVQAFLQRLAQALTAAGAHNADAWQEVPKYASHLEAYLTATESRRPLQLLRELVQGDNLLGAILELSEFSENLDPQDFVRWAAAAESRRTAADPSRLHRAGSRRHHRHQHSGRLRSGARQLWQATGGPPRSPKPSAAPYAKTPPPTKATPCGCPAKATPPPHKPRTPSPAKKSPPPKSPPAKSPPRAKATPCGCPAKTPPRPKPPTAPPAKAPPPPKPHTTPPAKTPSPRLTPAKTPSASPSAKASPPPNPQTPPPAKKSPTKPTAPKTSPAKRPPPPKAQTSPARKSPPTPRSSPKPTPPRPTPKPTTSKSPRKPTPPRPTPKPTTSKSPLKPAPPRPTPKPTTPAKPAPLDLNDPLNQLIDWTQRVKSLGGSITFLTKDPPSAPAPRRHLAQSHPPGDLVSAMVSEGDGPVSKGGQLAGGRQLKQANISASLLNVGFDWFKPRRIGIVFHVLQFRDSSGVLQPQRALANGDQPARLLLDVINTLYRYSGTNVQFYIKEYRTSTSKYQYLDLKTRQAWQQCGNAQIGCSCVLAKNNLDSRRYVNIYVAGSQAFPGFTSASGAITTSNPGYLDLCEWAFRTNYTLKWDQDLTPRTQNVWLLFDFLDPESQNSAGRYHLGATTVAHELAHMLGVRHTFDTKGECSDQDQVGDTPPDKLNDWQKDDAKSAELNAICENLSRWGKLPNREQLAGFDSCRGDKYGDNVFNLMNYVPGGCWVMLTRGQVRQLQRRTTDYQQLLGVGG